MGEHVCVDVRIDVRVDMCVDVWTDIGMDMCVGMCISKGGVLPNQGLGFTKLAPLVKLCTNRGDW